MTERNLFSSERSSHLSGTLAAPSNSAQPQPLREAVEMAMRRYFEHLDGSQTTDLYAW